MSSLIDLIEVTRPYLALHAINRTEVGADAVVRPEQDRDGEIGPIGAAELGRHMAILGSMAAATGNPRPGPHFYLAFRAHIDIHADGAARTALAEGSTPLLLAGARGACRWEKGRASASVEAFIAGQTRPYATLKADYIVRDRPWFEKAFAQHARETPSWTESPFARKADRTPIVRDGQMARMTLDTLDLGTMAGHFDGFPALPIAIVAARCTRLAATVSDIAPGAPVFVDHIRAQCESLAFAGQAVELVAHRGDDGEVTVAMRADGAQVGAFVLRVRG